MIIIVKLQNLLLNNSQIMTLFQLIGKAFNHVVPIDKPQRELHYFEEESIPFHSIYIFHISGYRIINVGF